ncbi:MAG: hypothetical protein IPP83_15565 [Flavobacteriales bacterium]|nr:hypothetical protein [Flavobacteriales bacterium]
MSDLLRPTILFGGIVLLSTFLLLFVRHEIGSVGVEETMVVVFSLSKTIFFVIEMFRHIARTAHQVISQQRIFAMIGLYAMLFVVSFAFDHWALLEVDPTAIAGVAVQGGAAYRLSEMLYYSVSTFTTAGFGDLFPVSTTARLLAATELMLAFFLTILVIANFSNLRDHFKNRNGK